MRFSKSAQPLTIRQENAGGQIKISGYLVSFGTPDEKDLYDTYFTRDTDYFLDVYSHQPIFFDHTLHDKAPGMPDDMPRRFLIGRLIRAAVDDLGVWVEGIIDQHSKWVTEIVKLIEAGAMHFSSGSVPHLVVEEEDGRMSSWPIIEASVTASPAEPRMTNVYVARAAYRSIGEEAALERLLQAGRARRAGHATNHPIREGDFQMTLEELYAYLRTVLNARWAEVGESLAAVRADGGGDATSQIEDMLQPIADEAASLLGVDASDVISALVQLALTKLGGGVAAPVAPAPMDMGGMPMMSFPIPATAPAPAPVPAARAVPEPAAPAPAPVPSAAPQPVIQMTPEQFQAAMTEAVRMASAQPRGAYQIPTGVTSYSPSRREGLAEYVRAIRDHDMAVVKRINAKARAQVRAMGIDPANAGGYLVAPEYSTEIIELLRKQSLFLGDGPASGLIREMPMARDTMNIPRQNGASTATWTGENETITDSNLEVGQTPLVAKKLAALVKVSNELIDDGGEEVDRLIREDFAAQMQRAVDNTILYGKGTSNQPLGIYNFPGVTVQSIAAVPVLKTLQDGIQTIKLANVPEDDTWAWILNPQDEQSFQRIKDPAGHFIWHQNMFGPMEDGAPGRLLGLPYYVSTQVAGPGAASTYYTDAFLGRFGDIVFGLRKTIEIKASGEAGTAFSDDQTWLRAIMRCDITLRHAESFYVFSNLSPTTGT